MNDADVVALHAVYWLNKLNAGLAVLRTKMDRIARRDPECAEFLGLIAVCYHAEKARDELRERVSFACAPWFFPPRAAG